MPIYEYECELCKRISSFLVLRSESVAPHCRHCGSKKVRRIISRISILKGEERRMEELLDPAQFSDLDENDPRSIERFVKKVGRELGEDASELEEAVEEAMREGSKDSEEL
jgi:putative FmdB family regulatory protein